ncbi:MAG: hypothetical protein HQM04_07115 [Magnetococcales bacterium]|nr:hypothetical protein [Magnetococcales bacterium]MBF0114799.1 hypothetical protein [Magnetococcales bacterium]
MPSSPPSTPGKSPQPIPPAEKPLVPRLQRLLAGQPQEEVILDPDNPNLIMERQEKQ